MFIRGVDDISDKLFGSVNHAAKKFNLCCGFSVISGVVNTGDKFSLVALTLLNNECR
jgi:hypothetical protein